MCPWIYLCVLCEINQRAHWCIVLDIYIYVCVCVCLYLCVLCVPATQHISLRRGLWISTALQHTATHCNTWQHTATHCTRCNSDTAHIFAQRSLDFHRTATHCHTLQHVAAHCNTLHTLQQRHSTYLCADAFGLLPCPLSSCHVSTHSLKKQTASATGSSQNGSKNGTKSTATERMENMLGAITNSQKLARY